jgi:hypothetical protein
MLRQVVNLVTACLQRVIIGGFVLCLSLEILKIPEETCFGFRDIFEMILPVDRDQPVGYPWNRPLMETPQLQQVTSGGGNKFIVLPCLPLSNGGLQNRVQQ